MNSESRFFTQSFSAFLQQFGQPLERAVLCRRRSRIGLSPRLEILEARVLVLVAVDAEQLPIRAVGRIVVVVAILMVHGELAQPLALECPRAARADVRQELQRLGAVPGVRGHPAIIPLSKSVNKSQNRRSFRT